MCWDSGRSLRLPPKMIMFGSDRFPEGKPTRVRFDGIWCSSVAQQFTPHRPTIHYSYVAAIERQSVHFWGNQVWPPTSSRSVFGSTEPGGWQSPNGRPLAFPQWAHYLLILNCGALVTRWKLCWDISCKNEDQDVDFQTWTLQVGNVLNYPDSHFNNYIYIYPLVN